MSVPSSSSPSSLKSFFTNPYLIGALGGGLAGLGLPSLFSSKSKSQPGVPEGYEQYSLPTMGGGQQDIYNLLSTQFKGGAGDVYQRLFGLAQGDQGQFAQMEAPALRQFQQQIAPQIAQRYAGSGIGASSGMQNALASAGGNLAENLQANRMNLMQQSIRDVLGLGEHLLGTQTQQYGLVKKDNPLNQLMQLLGVVGSGAASGLAMGAML